MNVAELQEAVGKLLQLMKEKNGNIRIWTPIRDQIERVAALTNKLVDEAIDQGGSRTHTYAAVTQGGAVRNKDTPPRAATNTRAKKNVGQPPKEKAAGPAPGSPPPRPESCAVVCCGPTPVPVSAPVPAKTRSPKSQPQQRRAIHPPPPTHPRAKRPRQETVIVARGPDAKTTYASILAGLNTEAAKEANSLPLIKSVRRNAKGELILRPKANGAILAAAIRRIAAEDKDGLTVRHREPTRTLLIRDVPEGIESRDVLDALCKSLGESSRPNIRVGPMVPTVQGSARCTAHVPDCAEARSLARGERLVVGLVICRLRDRVEVTRCYRCLGFGHVAARCQGDDRSSLCGRCGSEGHRASDCSRPPKCVVCPEESAHIRGSGQCQNFLRALKEARGK